MASGETSSPKYILSGSYNPNKIQYSISKAETVQDGDYLSAEVSLTSSGRLYVSTAYFKGTYKYILVFK